METHDDGLPHSPFEVEVWLAQWIAEVPGVSAIAGALCVYPVYLPSAKSAPGITYTRTATARGMLMRGASGLAMPTFELACIGPYGTRGLKQACALGRAVRLGVNGLKTDDQARGQYVQRVDLTNEFDRIDAALFADGTAGIVHQRVLTIDVNHIEEVKRLIRDATGEA